ncbi:MAG TPA: leucine--tRNA ligase [Actinomycetota bacterium]|nr:leucine--tRNA ligase [Actinomycetota bacterium]
MTDEDRYDPSSIEPKWVDEWERTEPYRASDDPNDPRPRFYALDMFPYPSGDLHMGHLEALGGGDVIARYWMLRGYNVLHPIGWDAFGLPAENAAIKRGANPRSWTYENIEQQAKSFKRLGMSFDWSRRFNTCDPGFYTWTQWLFLKLREAGVAYRSSAPVNWCPNDKTVLANEQVVQGRCERCDAAVVKRDVTSWFFRESAYAQRLLDDMDQLTGWSEHVKIIQRNWIGRSEGADVTFAIAETGEQITIFTTRPDTLWGVTFFVIAPEHPMARVLAERAGKAGAFEAYLREVGAASEIERTALGRRKLGFDTGAHAVNPVNGEQVPVYVADYVLMEYGTGAIMAVPAHDQRDFEFARQEGLPVRVVIQPEGGALDGQTMEAAYDGEGRMSSSGHFDGSPTPESIAKVIAWLEEQQLGTGRVRYRLRDWNVSRQRFWGCPIPIVYCEQCGDVAVPDDQLPVLLPDLEDYTPTEEGESPLAKVTDWVNTSCPQCGSAGKRDIDTFDTFVDSSWYFFRYCSPHTGDAPFDRELVERWLPANQYIGGDTHATGHLIYSRFFTKALYDLGMISFTEPYPNLFNQGTVIMEGAKMSKSRGNLVTPSAIVDEFGADTARVTMLFAGPYEADIDWADVSPHGVFRWLSRVWRLAVENAGRIVAAGAPSGEGELRRRTHRAIQGAGHDTERFRFNTAISKLMVLTNDIAELAGSSDDADVAEAVRALVVMLNPYAPFITEEVWHRLGGQGHLIHARWPEAIDALAARDSLTMVVQVNGRVRDKIEVVPDISGDAMEALARASDKVAAFVEGKTVVKTIVVPPKLVNIVVRD